MSTSTAEHESAEAAESTPWFSRWPLLTLLGAIVVVDFRLFSAGFVGFDDDIHVYANPFLNPPTLESVTRLWQQAYEQLYVPLAYTLFAAIAVFARVPAHMDSSVGHAVSVEPALFHCASIGFHVANTWLCFLFARELTRRAAPALLCALVFALHPLQLESVGWISELRGLSSSCFALLALNALVRARRAGPQAAVRSRKLLAAAALCVACAMLCKPAAVVLPLVALALDLGVLETPRRAAMTTAAIWSAATVPFALVTHSLQTVSAAGESDWWQRPFIAGDALAFYLFKTFLPLDLGVDYGRTPRLALAHAWGYLAWIVPLALLAACYSQRQRRPLTWLGALLFVTFLLPTLGLVPFAFQAYSTVADRYTYLALIGIGLIVADTVEHAKTQPVARRSAGGALLALAVLSFQQSGFWLDNSDFFRHTLDVNPDAAFAYNNLGDVELANGDSAAALADYQACVRIDPTRAKAYINLAEIYATSQKPMQAEAALAAAQKTAAMTADDFSNLGIVLMKMNEPERALAALSTASTREPSSPTYLYNQANAFSATGQFDKAEVTFRRCLSLAPTLAGAHTGLGIVLAETHRLPAAVDEFRAAVRLQPNDAAAMDDLKKAEALLAGQSR